MEADEVECLRDRACIDGVILILKEMSKLQDSDVSVELIVASEDIYIGTYKYGI